MRIASVEISGRIFLAPLAAYTSWPFRRICRRFGAALVTTEVVKARELLRGIPATLQVLDFKPDEHPIAGQLLASDPAEAGEGAARLGEMGFDIVDLNCGCPKRRVLSDGMGGALMASPEQVEKIVAQMVRRARTPVTVKMRAGRFKDQPTAVEMARRCEGAGAAALCVHPRPAEGAAAAPPDWRIIAEVKRAVSIPVTGNGGIHTPADVARMFRETGCDAVAVGQAAIGRPWIFRQAAALLDDGTRDAAAVAGGDSSRPARSLSRPRRAPGRAARHDLHAQAVVPLRQAPRARKGVQPRRHQGVVGERSTWTPWRSILGTAISDC